MKDLLDVFKKIDKFTIYLLERGFPFSPEGYPIFDKSMFLTEIPEMMVPVFQKKNKRVIKERTVIVFFCGDDHIYRRLDTLFEDIDEYKQYLGVAGFDVTVTRDMDLEWQRAVILLNQLSLAVLASNGIKIVFNTRTGIEATRDMFKYVPRGIMVASGFRGGTRKNIRYNFDYISKILLLLPDIVLIYGECDEDIVESLDRFGVARKEYPPFRELCKEAA